MIELKDYSFYYVTKNLKYKKKIENYFSTFNCFKTFNLNSSTKKKIHKEINN